MSYAVSADMTRLLREWQGGCEESRDALFHHAHQHLQEIAGRILRDDRQRQALQTGDLVNECVIRMFDIQAIDWRSRAHFSALVATTMRRILIDEARRQSALKRDVVEVTLVTDEAGGQNNVDLEVLDRALQKLTNISPELAQIVELKYFGGLTNEEISELVDASDSTVKRSWRTARAWLYNELND